ncbi:peptide ABC transporter ATP-binding protein [Deltaproteobacteria bacterium Smac51]|nr:peptide ABC transporter ATP-binding protein [Deltaproteobacteria bacterium Smac51]
MTAAKTNDYGKTQPRPSPVRTTHQGLTQILKLENLSVSFEGGLKPAVRGVSFSLMAGEIVGLVGESGSGKSLTALSLMGLLPSSAVQDGGRIIFKGQDLGALSPDERRRLCGTHLGMVFQEPLTALNPVLSIGEQVAEIYRLRCGKSYKEALAEAIEMLGRVGLPNPAQAAESFPHRFSGGMRQRVVLAMALALSPEILIADEPTTALDPTIAAQILELMSRLAAGDNSSVLFITHNLRLLKGLAQRVMVMYTGLIVEEAPVGEIFDSPAHPYTQGLLRALPPGLDEPAPERLTAIGGAPPVPGQWPAGCPFEPRCGRAFAPCRESVPPITDLGGGRHVRCFLYSSED